MKKALTAESLKKGIMQASPLAQTDCLEGFHSVLNLFAPKLIAYSYIGMYCRYFHFYYYFPFFVCSFLLLPICTSYMFNCGRHGSLMVSALDSGASGPGSRPAGREHCVVFLGKTINCHGASLHPTSVPGSLILPPPETNKESLLARLRGR